MSHKKSKSTKGLKIQRFFTEKGKDPLNYFEYELRTSRIANPDGSLVFEMKNVEVPKDWSQVATDILAQKYCRKKGVPQRDKNGKLLKDDAGNVILGAETSAKMVVTRLASTWRYWGEKHGYFASKEMAQAFEDEMIYMLLAQMAAPNSPQWFNTGLAHAYGITGDAQGHYYVDPQTEKIKKSKDAYTRPQPHACGRWDTKIFTQEGLMNLGHIVEKNRVGLRIFDGKNWVRILAVKENGVKSLYRMQLKNGQYIDFTDDHLIWASDKRKKEGDNYGWISLKDCLGKKVQYVSAFIPKFVEVPVGVAVAEAALAGFHVGDGYHGVYNKSTHFGVIANDPDEFVYLSGLFEKIFGGYTVTEKPEIGPDYRIIRRDFAYTQLFAERYGLGVGSRAVRIHDTIFAADPEVKCAFLRGLFQADGCVRIRKRGATNSGDICLTTISDALAHDVQTLLLSLGIYSCVSKCRDSREDRSLQYHVEIAYASERKKYENMIGFISARKQKKLVELNHFVDGKEEPAIAEETVVSVDYLGDEVVYDLQTESAQFLANGVVVHNCFIQSVDDDLVNEGGIFDLVTREARLFKYGSGTGTNFSKLRGVNEHLSGGGQSSGLMSFLAVFDRAAGAIKSGGTTRRAAKMVCLDMDHPEIENFIDWKLIEEQKVASLHTGSHLCYEQLKKIVESACENGLDAEKNPDLKKKIYEARSKHVSLNYIKRVLMLVEHGMKAEEFSFRRYDTDFRSEAYLTVGGQNSNNSVRVPNAFINAVRESGQWSLINRKDGTVYKTISAQALWDKIAYAAWSCADPGIQFDTTINEWHTCPEDGRIKASNPCSEYMFLDDTACNLASLNLIKFYDNSDKQFDVKSFSHAVRLWTMVLEISVLMAQFPSKAIAQLSYDFRTLGLGYANIGTMLMRMGIPYTSEKAYAITGAITAIMCGESYAASAEMASILGTFKKYQKNKKHMLRVIRNHRRAAYNQPKHEFENLTIAPVGINSDFCPEYMLVAAKASWDHALHTGEQFGYRNAQVTVIAPTGTIGLLMDCDTTGIEPDFALVKFKKLVGGGYFKIVNQSLAPALETLGYSQNQIEDIANYVRGHATLQNCPHINAKSLKAKGFTDKEILAVESQLLGVFELKFAFNRFSLGEEFCRNVLGLGEAEMNDLDFDMLLALGFSKEQIEEANEYVCGTMTIEAAPHLKKEHYPVFDCANKCGKKGQRYIPYVGHLRMMAAAQPFISGSISKTINMPEECSFHDIQKAYMESWELMLKCNAIYRDNSKLSQPLNSSTAHDRFAQLFQFEDMENIDETVDPKIIHQTVEKIVQKPLRRKLPEERHSITHKFSISGHEGYITVGLYGDGQPGEIFIKMSKEGSTLSGIMDALALSVSMNLQYGVPLEVLVAKFCHSRFEPAGMTGNRDIPMVKSIIDYLGRWLALKFLSRDTAKKYHNSDLVDRAYNEGTNLFLPQVPIEHSPSFDAHGDATRTHRLPVKEITGTTDAANDGVSLAMPVGEPQKVAVHDISHLTREEFAKIQKDRALYLNNEDAAVCSACGAVMVRNGSCYKCLDCGETSGCS